MLVSEAMTRDVRTIGPSDTVQQAAKLMDDLNVGVIPVCDGQRLVGMITDRDITIRATSAGKNPSECKVEDAMSADVNWCFEDEDIDEVAHKMADKQVRRVPVVNRDKKLVGIVSLGDLATGGDLGAASQTLKDVSEPSQPTH